MFVWMPIGWLHGKRSDLTLREGSSAVWYMPERLVGCCGWDVWRINRKGPRREIACKCRRRGQRDNCNRYEAKSVFHYYKLGVQNRG
jgi:hypothetical protein